MGSKIDINELTLANAIMDLWDPLSEEQRTFLIRNATIQRFKKNERIYSEGETPTRLMCLIEGKIKIFKDGVGGRNQIMRVIKPVEYFGYRASFAEEDYKTSASSFESSVVCFIPMTTIKCLVNANNKLALYFIKQLSVDLGVSDERTVSLTQKHIRGRLAEALLFLKDNYGVEEDGFTLSIYLSREDMASLSNMTTSNAIRTLSNFANEKMIAIDGRKIKIIQEDMLRKVSDIG
jgi:CRP/FNR family transcriptional regulator, polysaccharide utilization system transcription regulator